MQIEAIKVMLEALDNKVITKRTGKTKALGKIKKLPENGDYLMVVFDESENIESPGVYTEINNLEQINKEYRYYDYDDRPFKITLVD
jgi:hypothetical protein